MIIETPPTYRGNYISFEFATQPWQVAQYMAVRKRIFCEEQRVFSGHDRDAIDAHALPIMAVAYWAGILEDVAGVVRIDEREPGIWYGGRLGVMSEYRQLANLDTKGLFDNNASVDPFARSVGAALIFKAVTTAQALGCQRFFANVQEQNVRFFERMHWTFIETIDYCGMPHARMEADLAHYPASIPSISQLVAAGVPLNRAIETHS